MLICNDIAGGGTSDAKPLTPLEEAMLACIKDIQVTGLSGLCDIGETSMLFITFVQHLLSYLYGNCYAVEKQLSLCLFAPYTIKLASC